MIAFAERTIQKFPIFAINCISLSQPNIPQEFPPQNPIQEPSKPISPQEPIIPQQPERPHQPTIPQEPSAPIAPQEPIDPIPE